MIPKNRSPRILLFDIETSPILARVWGLWEQNVVYKEEEWHMLSFACKWLEEKETHVFALPDYKGYKKDMNNDLELCKELWNWINEADIVIAHNGDEFDIKKANARFIYHGLKPTKFYLSIDTKKVAKKYFKFDSNSLSSLGEYLSLGEKVDTGGYSLWKGCLLGDPASWKKMKIYNKQDVVLLEKVYLTLRPWMKTHPVVSTEISNCPNCDSTKMVKDGFYRSGSGLTYQKWECQSCGACSRSRIAEKVKPITKNGL